VVLDHSCQVQRHPLRERGDDAYMTPPCATEALLRHVKLPPKLWECACGDGTGILDVLSAHGHEGIGSDLGDYGRPDCFWRRDFLMERKAPDGCEGIITNPPLCEGHHLRIPRQHIKPVDLIAWDNLHPGMGKRSRRRGDYLLVLQKPPIKAGA